MKRADLTNLIACCTAAGLLMASPTASSQTAANLQTSVCNRLLLNISQLQLRIDVSDATIAQLIKWKNEEARINNNLREKESAYQVMSSVIAIYQSLECSQEELIAILHCPTGSSRKCR